jgi:hypothetical protein
MYNNRYIIIDVSNLIRSSSELKLLLLNGNKHMVELSSFYSFSLLIENFYTATDEKHSFVKSQFSSPVPL